MSEQEKQLYSLELSRKRTECLVCNLRLSVIYTDLHGEAVCWNCGTAYQTRAYVMSEVNLVFFEVQREDVRTPYIQPNSWAMREIYAAYWRETGRRVPAGTYLTIPLPASEIEGFWRWVYDHREQFIHIDHVLWDDLKNSFESR